MIIVSQDKKEIINFNNVERIDITVATDPVSFNVNFETNGTRDLMGQYETKERAKEVLQEIIEVFTDEEMFHISKSSLNNLDELAEPKYILRPISKPKVYYMPEI